MMESEPLATMADPPASQSWTLMVEDNPLDTEAVVRAWDEANLPAALLVESDGEAALRRLAAAPSPPSYVLLDLNMPRMSGFEFITAVRAIERFAMLPLVVFTTSARLDDRKRALTAGACGYFLKPMDYADLIDRLTTIHRYWHQSERAW